MKNIYLSIFLLLGLMLLVPSCYKDDGNYSYTDVESIQIDTTGIGLNSNYFTVNYGDTIKVSPTIEYDNSANISYSWKLIPYPYEEETVGNTTQYPEAVEIATTLDLEWIVDVEPGGYRYYLEVYDSVSGLTSSMYPNSYNYLNVISADSFYALMLLSEYDGSTDIDVYYTPLALIFSGETTTHFYSNKHGGMIPGNPKLISYSSEGYYYTFTDQEGLRLDQNDFLTMDDFSNMFYEIPTLNAQDYRYVSNQELLINDGKLHVLNQNLSNDRKFSSPIAGDYKAYPYITQKNTYSNTSSIACVIFDEQSKSFKPYYSGASELTSFGTASDEAYVDANDLPSEPLAIFTYDREKTGVILKDEEGKTALWLFNMFSEDDSNLSGNGSRSKIDLSACEDIDNATMFYAEPSGTSFHYATEFAVYGFSITSGESTSNKVYDLPEGDEVTCIYSLKYAGFPTAGRVYWIATWNEADQNGKLVEFEIDPYTGKADWYWGAMFGLPGPNPTVNEGFGKIKSMSVAL